MAKNINICNAERPMNFDQMVGQKTVVENLRQQAIRKEFFSVTFWKDNLDLEKQQWRALFRVLSIASTQMNTVIHVDVVNLVRRFLPVLQILWNWTLPAIQE